MPARSKSKRGPARLGGKAVRPKIFSHISVFFQSFTSLLALDVALQTQVGVHQRPLDISLDISLCHFD